MNTPAIVWFRRNLRLADNAALTAAVESGRPVLPLFIHGPMDADRASDWWLERSLQSLGSDLGARGADLLLLEGSASDLIPRIVHLAGAGQLHFDRAYAATLIAEQEYCGNAVEIETIGHDDYYLHPPGTVLTAAGTPYRVFTAFWKACLERGEPSRPIPPPVHIPGVDEEIMVRLRAQLPVRRPGDLCLQPSPDGPANQLSGTWRPGESSALARLSGIEERVAQYAGARDQLDLDATSRLSPHLHFGELGIRQAWHTIHDAAQRSGAAAGAQALLRQLYWREFSGQLLFHFPDLPDAPLRREFEHFAWSPDDDGLRDWQLGRTGYPVVDAGMRELLATGWLHNRARMIVASFLAKNLLISWTTGAAWFMNRLVDADLANNATNWQWVAGCGTDAAPYIRIWNPTLQGRKFDPEGRYVRRWLPELARLPNACLHEPWLADEHTQQSAGVRIGIEYPLPLVDLRQSRERALAAYRQVRSLVQSPAARPGSSVG